MGCSLVGTLGATLQYIQYMNNNVMKICEFLRKHPLLKPPFFGSWLKGHKLLQLVHAAVSSKRRLGIKHLEWCHPVLSNTGQPQCQKLEFPPWALTSRQFPDRQNRGCPLTLGRWLYTINFLTLAIFWNDFWTNLISWRGRRGSSLRTKFLCIVCLTQVVMLLCCHEVLRPLPWGLASGRRSYVRQPRPFHPYPSPVRTCISGSRHHWAQAWVVWAATAYLPSLLLAGGSFDPARKSLSLPMPDSSGRSCSSRWGTPWWEPSDLLRAHVRKCDVHRRQWQMPNMAVLGCGSWW